MIRFAVINGKRSSTRQEADTEDRYFAESVFKEYMPPELFEFAGHIVADTKMSPQFFIKSEEVNLTGVKAALQASGYIGKVIKNFS